MVYIQVDLASLWAAVVAQWAMEWAGKESDLAKQTPLNSVSHWGRTTCSNHISHTFLQLYSLLLLLLPSTMSFVFALVTTILTICKVIHLVRYYYYNLYCLVGGCMEHHIWFSNKTLLKSADFMKLTQGDMDQVTLQMRWLFEVDFEFQIGVKLARSCEAGDKRPGLANLTKQSWLLF